MIKRYNKKIITVKIMKNILDYITGERLPQVQVN